MTEIAVLAMYKRQKIIISQMFTQMAKHYGLQRNDFPKVETVDGFQSRESTMVILDTTVTNDLGFVDSENRMNMASTRAKDFLYLVGSRLTMAKSVEQDDEEAKTAPGDRFTSRYRKTVDIGGVR